jgi:hypothetical protein
MHTAGVVSDHAADRAPRMRGGIGPVHQPQRLNCALQIVEHDAWLHARRLAVWIDLENATHMP